MHRDSSLHIKRMSIYSRCEHLQTLDMITSVLFVYASIKENEQMSRNFTPNISIKTAPCEHTRRPWRSASTETTPSIPKPSICRKAVTKIFAGKKKRNQSSNNNKIP